MPESDAGAPPPLAYASPGTAAASAGPQRRLSLADAVGIIVGVVVGAGIFETAGPIASAAGSPTATLAFWAVGGLISLVGALCYAELATAYPKQGGEYVFLTRAYGPRVGFLFAWTEFWIVRPGSIGAMAYVFGHYAGALTTIRSGRPQQLVDPTVWAAAAVIGLTALNVLGVRAGTRTQNVLTAAKVIGIGAVIVLGTWAAGGRAPAGGNFFDGGTPDHRLALIFILFTYGGWNEIAYVAAEVRHPARNISRALVIGVALVSLVYVLFTVAVLPGLQHEHGMDERYQWAASISWALGGHSGGWRWLAILVCVSSLGAVQGMIFAGSRIYYAVGTDHAAYRWLGRWDDRGGGTPVRSLLAQGAVTLAVVLAFQNFHSLVIFTTPVFWFFFLLAAVSLFVLRVRDRDVERPYRVPLYPLTPILFAASCLFMLHASLTYAWDMRRWEALWSIGLLLAGIVASFLTTRATGDRSGRPRAPSRADHRE